VSLRNVDPPIQTAVLRRITEHFANPHEELKLDPSFEFTHKKADPKNTDVMKELQKMESVGLVKPLGEEHMYWAAIHGKSCKLTALGMQYWKLVQSGNI
jgi:hypothetical protein